MQEKNCTNLKPSPRITIYYHVAFSPGSLFYCMTVQRLDGEWEGLGAVLTRSLHTLDNILVSSVVGQVYGLSDHDLLHVQSVVRKIRFGPIASYLREQ